MDQSCFSGLLPGKLETSGPCTDKVYSIKSNCTLLLSPGGEKVAKQHLQVSLYGKHKYSDRNKNSALGFSFFTNISERINWNAFLATQRSSQ